MSPASIPASRIGVLLVNLGTPDATDYWSMRRYLKEFLSDRRVIEENRIKWWLVLNLIILTARPGRKGRDYDKIWNRARNESPLKTTTRAQAEKLDDALRNPRLRVDWAMRYGNPSIVSRLDALTAQGCDRILIVPLYPQYAAATTATVKKLAKSGVKNLAVITPGFAADCLETLEEIAMENGDIFKSAGGKNFAAIPCLNDSEPGMAMLRTLVTNELKGWV
jgi:protoheme ferro-lyase